MKKGTSRIQDSAKRNLCAKFQVKIQRFRHPHLVLKVRLVVRFLQRAHLGARCLGTLIEVNLGTGPGGTVSDS